MDRLAKILTFIFVLAGAALFLWGSDKSFDFTDEGLYLLVYQHPQEFPDSYTSYHRVGAVVSQWVGGNIIALRLLGFFLTSAATWYFGLALVWFLKGRQIPLLDRSGDRFLLLLGLQGSVLAAYCWLPPTPNYNTMAGIGMLLSCGGILAFFSSADPRHSIGKAIFGILAIGTGLLLAFLAKGSSAVGIALISILLLGICSLVGVKEKILFAVFVSVSLLAAGSILFVLMPDLFRSWEFFLGSIVALTEGNGARDIIQRHWQESLEFAMRHVRSFVLPILLAVGASFFARSRFQNKLQDRKENLVFWLVGGILAVEVVLLLLRETYLGGISGREKSFIGYTSLFLLLLTLRVGIPNFAKSIEPIRVTGFLIFLFWLGILPFVTAAGTTHKIFINALLHAAPLFAAILLVASALDKSLQKPIALPVSSILIVALSFSQFFYGFVLNPYRTQPKWKQTVPAEIGVPSTRLKVDPATAECIEKAKVALRGAGFRPGDDILALYGLPGLVYAVGGVSPQRPWFFDDHGPGGDEANLRALKGIPSERIKRAFLFLTNEDERALSQLLVCGVDVAGDFESIGSSFVPFKKRQLEIFKPLKTKAGAM